MAQISHNLGIKLLHMDEARTKKASAAYIEDFRAHRAFLILEANKLIKAERWYELIFSIVKSTVRVFFWIILS